jgi:hypothetical protein
MHALVNGSQQDDTERRRSTFHPDILLKDIQIDEGGLRSQKA